MYSHAKVDLAMIPDGPEKNTFVMFAEKHNAVVDVVSINKQDLDQVTGFTPEEKAATYGLLSKVRFILGKAHGKRFTFTLASIQIYVVLNILKSFGMTTDQFKHVLDLFISLLDKLVLN